MEMMGIAVSFHSVCLTRRFCANIDILESFAFPNASCNLPVTNAKRGKPMKFIKIAAVAVAIAASTVQASAQSALNEILSEGVLKVGTTGDWNPMSMRNVATNTYEGYDIDVMTALAADLGVEIEFVPTDWKTLVAGVTSGQYHITGSASVSPARAKAAGYSNSYFSLATVP
jgi:cyclohexadienyl dehydratase